MKAEKRSLNTSTMLLELPIELSNQIARQKIELSERGVKTTKANLILAHVRRSLAAENGSVSLYNPNET